MRVHAWVITGVALLLFSRSGLEAAAPAGPENSQFIIDCWTTENGLPQNEVTSILQTHDDYLWVGTLGGLVRFDGIRFKVYDEGNTPGLTSARILNLFEDSQRNLWIGTANGGVFQMQGTQVSRFDLGQELQAGRLAAAGEGADGAIWLHLTNDQLIRIGSGRTNRFAIGAGPTTEYRGLAVSRSGPCWVGTDHFLLGIDNQGGTNGTTLPVEQSIVPGKLDYLLASRDGGFWCLADGRVFKSTASGDLQKMGWGWYPWLAFQFQKRLSTACEDRDGNLIVGTLGAGLFWFNSKGEAAHISTNQGLSNDYVLSLHMDRQGDLWVGTDGGGLNRVKRPVFGVLESTRGLVVKTVSEDSKGGLWIGCNPGNLFYWRDGTSQPMELRARAVLVDRKQRIWAGTDGAGLIHVQGNRLRPVPGFDPALQFVNAIHQDRRGGIWVGAQRGLAYFDETVWKTFTEQDGLTSRNVQAIVDDAEGNLWVGTEGGGLIQWKDGKRLAEFRKGADGLPSDNVSALYVDAEGILWIGTDGGGLARLAHGQWTRLTREAGLASNSIGYILEDDQGFLWLGSNAGLMRSSKRALNDFALGRTNTILCRVYGRPDGLPIRECSSGSQPGPWRSRDGTLWFPTIKGLAFVNPAALRPNPNPPPVRIEAVSIDGQALPNGASASGEWAPIRVPPGKERIEIQFSSLNLSAPDRTRFRYRLGESEWSDAGTVSSVHYDKLPPAEYRFQVSACNEDGVWNESGATLAFTMTPLFWKTWWFLTTVAGSLIGGVAVLVHYISTQKLQRQLMQLRQREALESERSRIARDIHDQLGASLTQVALLGELVESDKDAPAEVEAHARQISQTARDTTRVLDEIVWAVNPANDTLDGLITYICKYTQEYLTVAGLQYRLDVPSPLPTTQLPPEVRHNVFLACKEAVTNIVRHAQASAVWVRLRLADRTFILEIEDNGRGPEGQAQKTAQGRNGVRNMRNRLEEVGGGFHFAPAPERGTLVRLTVPLG